MGRLPAMWADRVITMRSPYEMPGEVLVTDGQTGQQFPEATFMNNVDKPFECHRMKPFIIALDEGGIALNPQPEQDLLLGLVRLSIEDTGKNLSITKNPALAALLVKGSSERTWEWADPYYMVRSESFQVVVDALDFPATAPIPGLFSLNVAVKFEGFLCVVAPASNTR